ncbi:MAG: DUF2283 domain-containing protein [Candidatus Electrothrix sp. AW2]|jgi:uncharacterized protein YuzE|nr:DUF2283 domain-containing protein [Candidatus Electrothrix gigas]MCI5191900.1 DUF2283 domain-containing protein [Candidatus Electrothrix gigas]
MKVKYFADTDTALIEFSNQEIIETREISENVYADFDENGNIVSMTVEHAKANAGLQEFSYQEMPLGEAAQAAG